MVSVQKWSFLELFFLGNIDKENVFYDILKRKNAFVGYKIKKFKKSKYWHFCRGVNPWFSPKNGYFSMVLFRKWPFFQLFFLRNVDQENVFYDIQERKNAFLGQKNKNFKKSKIWHFSKGVKQWFWSKNGH